MMMTCRWMLAALAAATLLTGGPALATDYAQPKPLAKGAQAPISSFGGSQGARRLHATRDRVQLLHRHR